MVDTSFLNVFIDNKNNNQKKTKMYNNLNI